MLVAPATPPSTSWRGDVILPGAANARGERVGQNELQLFRCAQVNGHAVDEAVRPLAEDPGEVPAAPVGSGNAMLIPPVSWRRRRRRRTASPCAPCARRRRRS